MRYIFSCFFKQQNMTASNSVHFQLIFYCNLMFAPVAVLLASFSSG